MESDLTVALGVLVAFSTLMLLFSIFVTSLVQATVSITRLRSRNLWRGLTRVLREATSLGDDEASETAFTLLNGSPAGLMALLKEPGATLRGVVGPQVSWLSPAQLEEACRTGPIQPREVGAVVRKFQQTEDALGKRFRFWTRVITVFWAGSIAFTFQLSTPEILNHLGADPKLRPSLAGPGEQAAAEEAAAKDGDPAAGEGGSGEKSPPHDGEPALDEQRAASLYHVELWRHGWNFYADPDRRPQNLLGVLLTTMLLTLGAPFWFEVLKKSVSLRDVLSPQRSAEGEEADGAERPELDRRIERLVEKARATGEPLERAELEMEIDDLRLMKARLPTT